MKNKIILIIIIICNCTSISHAQWIQTNGPYGGPNVSCFAINGNSIFAGTDRGLFRSDNDGADWQIADAGMPSGEQIQSLAVATGNRIFAATYNSGIFLSVNNGTTWTAVNTGLTNSNIKSLTVVGGTTILAGTSGTDGIFRSTNYGSSWSSTTGPNYIGTLATVGSTVFASSAFGQYLSTNGGVFWTLANTGLTGINYAFLSYGSKIIAGGDGGVFTSANNGLTWSSTAYSGSPVLALAANTGNIFAGTGWNGVGDGVLLSADTCATWNTINSGLQYHSVLSLIVHGTTLFAGTTRGGIFISTNNGQSWSPSNKGIAPTAGVSSLVSIGSEVFAGTVYDGYYSGLNYGVFLTADSGTTWTAVNNGIPSNTSVFDLALNGTDIFAATDSGVFLSQTHGANWTSVNSGLTNHNVSCIITGSAGIFAGTVGDGVFLSLNNGSLWSPVSTGLPLNSNIKALASNGTDIFAGTDSGVYISNNNGALWSLSSNGLPANYSVYSLAVSGNIVYAGIFASGIYVSLDNGLNWSQANTGLLGNFVYDFSFYGNTIFAATNGGTFYSADSGATWINITGLSDTFVHSVMISGNSIYVGAVYSGVWWQPLMNVIASVEEMTDASEFLIYPNPASNDFSIVIPKNIRECSLTIFNESGSLVFKNKMLEKEFRINCNDFKSGIYLINLVADGVQITRKIVIQ